LANFINVMYSWKDKASYLVIFLVRIETETHGHSKANA